MESAFQPSLCQDHHWKQKRNEQTGDDTTADDHEAAATSRAHSKQRRTTMMNDNGGIRLHASIQEEERVGHNQQWLFQTRSTRHHQNNNDHIQSSSSTMVLSDHLGDPQAMVASMTPDYDGMIHRSSSQAQASSSNFNNNWSLIHLKERNKHKSPPSCDTTLKQQQIVKQSKRTVMRAFLRPPVAPVVLPLSSSSGSIQKDDEMEDVGSG